MILYSSSASPFARKVIVAAKALDVPLTLAAASPLDNPPELLAANPLGKIPALLMDDGTALYDSAVIVQALNDLGGGGLLPSSGPARWAALRDEAMADGIAEAGVALNGEKRRPAEQQSPLWIERYRNAILRSCDVAATALPPTAGVAEGALSLPAIALACALDYIDFRHPDILWRDGRPALAGWLDTVSVHPALSATKPR